MAAVSIFFGFIAFIIGIIIIRIALRIDTQVKNQEGMIKVLTKLWEKEGADPKELQLFQRKYKVK